MQESYLNKPNLERHSKEFKSDKKASTHKSKKKSQMMGSDVEYDNGNISPLYSNWDQVRHPAGYHRLSFDINLVNVGSGNAGTSSTFATLHH